MINYLRMVGDPNNPEAREQYRQRMSVFRDNVVLRSEWLPVCVVTPWEQGELIRFIKRHIPSVKLFNNGVNVYGTDAEFGFILFELLHDVFTGKQSLLLYRLDDRIQTYVHPTTKRSMLYWKEK